MSELTQSTTWLALKKHYDDLRHIHMRDMFESDENRFDKYSLQQNDILYDFSKNRVNDETINLLLQLAKDINLSQWIEKMLFPGSDIQACH